MNMLSCCAGAKVGNDALPSLLRAERYRGATSVESFVADVRTVARDRPSRRISSI
jgi:hypothetical protein